MSNTWELKSIAECAAEEPYATQIGPFGNALKAIEYTSSGIPVLRGINVNRGRFHDNDFVYIDEKKANELYKYESYPGDVLLVHKGTLGQIGLMPKIRKYDRYIMGNSMMRVRCNPNILLPEYLYYWLSSRDGRHYLLSRVSQVGVPQIQKPLTTLREAILPVPPIDEQEAIAHILGTLDDKIELNRRMNETLEGMARAIFKSWFVDFLPVRAKMEGRPTGLPPDIDALFPDSFQDSELGEIPKEWEVKALRDFLELAYGRALKKDNRRPGRIPVFGSNGQVGWHNEKLASGPGIIVGRKGNPGVITWSPTDFFAIDTTFYVVAKAECRSRYFLFHALIDHDLASLSADSAVPGLNRNLAYLSKQVLPPSNVLESFDMAVKCLFDQQYHNDQESRVLTGIRDSLLPKLISGEIRTLAH
ncbi:MAG TPA: restriction endonuclease subunit S [Anaerolineales bacterium]|nr:restriction endonuclease subunit S [Anaerolineales bacterium]